MPEELDEGSGCSGGGGGKGLLQGGRFSSAFSSQGSGSSFQDGTSLRRLQGASDKARAILLMDPEVSG